VLVLSAWPMTQHASPRNVQRRRTLVAGIIVGASFAAIGVLAIRRRQQPAASSHVTVPAPTVVPAVAPVPATTPAVAMVAAEEHARSLEERVRALERENADQAALIANAADHAIEVGFPEGFPDAQRAAVFRGVIDEAMRDCVLGARLATLSCEEPPCIATIDLGATSDTPKAVFDCAAWTRVYGRSLGTGGFNTVDCGDGRHAMVEVISPDLETWAGWKQLDADVQGHIEARYAARVKRLLDEHACR